MSLVWACGPQTSGFDAGPTDAGVDAGPRDGGRDAGPVDAGPEDGGTDAGIDAGPGDAGIDGGPADAGPDDAGPSDAGPVDAGFDAGPDDAGFDAGPDDAGFDAGPDDAGYCPPFTETPPVPAFASNAGLGEPCDVTLGTAVANCQDGLECRKMVPGEVAFCTAFCSDGFDCAPGGGGYCVSGAPNYCLAICDENHPCPTNLACVQNVCVPDCRYEPPTYCTVQFGDHTMCNRATGACETKTCSTSNDCPMNGTCDVSVNPHTCAYDCTSIQNLCCNLGENQECNPNTTRCSPGAPYAITGDQLVLPHLDLDGGIEEMDPDGGPSCMGECPSDDGGFEPVDGGPDTSPFDGGPLPDAGRPANGVNGDACAPASALLEGDPPQQGTCGPQRYCSYLTIAGFCVSSCTSDVDCGANGYCHPDADVCLVKCDSAPCTQVGAACQIMTDGSKFCLPDCRREWPHYCHDIIATDSTCDPTDGRCKQFNCPATACPAGNVCDTTRSPSVCRPDCRGKPANFCWAYFQDEGPWCSSAGICSQ